MEHSCPSLLNWDCDNCVLPRAHGSLVRLNSFCRSLGSMTVVCSEATSAASCLSPAASSSLIAADKQSALTFPGAHFMRQETLSPSDAAEATALFRTGTRTGSAKDAWNSKSWLISSTGEDADGLGNGHSLFASGP